MIKRVFVISTVLALVGLMVGCSDFLTGPESTTDPNIASDVSVNELIVAIQSNAYGELYGVVDFFVMMWMQQMAGVAQHYEGYDRFNVTPDVFDDLWWAFYGGGALIDMKILQKKALAEEKYTHVGIAKMWEALMMSTAADVWGDIPYSQAAQPAVYKEPVYDNQSDVHNAILELIDSAIQDFNTGQAFFDGSFDFTYEGDKDKWIAAAHTLKARILLNWAEVNQGNYALALAEAQQGIASDADNWKARYSTAVGEEAMWWQFEAYRFGYIRAGNYLVELLKAHNDPRLPIYFGKDAADSYSGSKSGESNGNACWLNMETFGAKDWNADIVSWFENQFIIAECQYATGDEAGALATLNDVIQSGLEAKWGLDANSLPRYTGLTGVDLLEAIMLEKYKAMFLNIQVWSDWRRTAFPIFDYVYEQDLGRRVPRRFLYAEDEFNTNPNMPNYADPLYQRVENDPGNPSYPGRTVNP